ncbi:hypothetical protein DPP11_16210 [Salmonella enterica subsp. enterica]|nr:hypothetical protein [Salmonella enterica subsp. enterica]
MSVDIYFLLNVISGITILCGAHIFRDCGEDIPVDDIIIADAKSLALQPAAGQHDVMEFAIFCPG